MKFNTNLTVYMICLDALKPYDDVKYSTLDDDLKDKIREIVKLPRITEIYGELYKGKDLYGLA
jgi:hypothetical protein